MLMIFGDDRVQKFDHHGPHCKNKAQRARPRYLHQSNFILGNDAPCYTTSHKQTFSGRSADGRPLVFHRRELCYPSQHHSRLNLGDIHAPQQSLLQTHTKEVHGPKRITAKADPTAENWARYRSGRAVRELTNPEEPSEPWIARNTASTVPVTDQQPTFGRQTRWHQHNILTGEQRQSAGPNNVRLTRHKQLWAARRWETDCCTLRLY